MSAPGNRGLIASPASMIASTPRPIAKRPGICLGSACDERQRLLRKRAVARFDAQHRGRLQNENMSRDADEKACRHRNGQKVGDEAEPEGAGANENEPDGEAERRRGGGVMLRSRRRRAPPARRRKSARWSKSAPTERRRLSPNSANPIAAATRASKPI